MIQHSQQSPRVGITFMAIIFFIFGFVTNFNMALKDQVQVVFDLSATSAQLVNAVFFFAYFCFSFICSQFIKMIGYKNGIISGLLLITMGSYLFYPAVAGVPSYVLFLVAIFILATGVVFLQTAANPYIVALGAQATAPARLNLVQAMNSIATTMAPFLVGLFILTPTSLAKGPQLVQVPFIVIGSVVLLIAFGVYFIKLPSIQPVEISTNQKGIWQHPQIIWGALGIFCYVGAEVGCSTQIVPYLETEGFAKEEAGRLVAVYWAGGMIGRFLGSVMLSNLITSKKYSYSAIILFLSFFVGWFIFSTRITNSLFTFHSQLLEGGIFLGMAAVHFLCMRLGRGNPNYSLGIFGVMASILVMFAFYTPISFGIWALLFIGFFNSIMFPTIFSLGVRDLGITEMPIASGIINTLIVGGAIIPLAMGWCTDQFGARSALILPALCYAYIVFFALKGSKIR